MPEQPSSQIEKELLDGCTLAIRELIKHENDLVNQRIGWLVQTQGLLFAALAFAWEKAPKLSYIIASVGIATAISIGSAIALYSPTVRRLEDRWRDVVPECERNYRLINGGAPRSRRIGWLLRPWRALPVIFITTWLAVVVIRLFM